MENPTEETATPLLDDVVPLAVDHRGRPAARSSSGGWRSASFIICVEIAERFAYYGINSNLINYLTEYLGQSTATAAVNVNAWTGAASLLPLFGAFVADSYLGRYRTIIIASLLYILGLGLLTFSAVFPFSTIANCQNALVTAGACSSHLQVVVFFFALYLVAAAQGGHKPCVQAFGADQFDVHDPKEQKERSSFFNWWYFGMTGGNLVTLCVLNYIQDNLGWGLGFGIPCIVMSLSLIIFLLGTMTYRFTCSDNEENPFLRIGRVFVVALKDKKMPPSTVSEEEAPEMLSHPCSQQFKFLNKALLAPDGANEGRKSCNVREVEEAKAVLRLIPIWSSCLAFGVVFAQAFTFFTKQGATMDRSVSPGFEAPAASLQSFINLAIVVFIPLYDRVLVPIARTMTRKPAGITMLQRIGIGLVSSIVCMVVAAVVERKRLKRAQQSGLVDMPEETVPMTVCWLIPQYLLFGIAEVFTMVGLQEFFYDQVPSELRSIGLALYLSIFGVGSFLSSFLVYIIEKATGGETQDSWFSDNLNRAHLDYYYWLLAGLSSFAFVAYLYFAKSYVYNRQNSKS